MKIAWEIGKIQYYLADVIQGLKSLPDNSVDLVVYSPPFWWMNNYRIEGQGGLEPTVQKYINWMARLNQQVLRVAKHRGSVLIDIQDSLNAESPVRAKGERKGSKWSFRRPLQAGYFETEAFDIPGLLVQRLRRPPNKLNPFYRLYFKQRLIWRKTNSGSMAKGSFTPYDISEILHFGANKRFLKRNRPTLAGNPWSSRVFEFPVDSDPIHPCPMPYGLAWELITHACPQGGVVLDCFAGRGTTLKAAADSGRQAIGIDLSQEYSERAFEYCRQLNLLSMVS